MWAESALPHDPTFGVLCRSIMGSVIERNSRSRGAALSRSMCRTTSSISPLHAGRLPDPLRTVVIGRPVHRHCAARTANAHLPGAADMIDDLTLAGRLHIFRRMT